LSIPYDLAPIAGAVLIILAVLGFAWCIHSYRKSKKQELKVRVSSITL